jgi:hypothetical protein
MSATEIYFPADSLPTPPTATHRQMRQLYRRLLAQLCRRLRLAQVALRMRVSKLADWKEMSRAS